MLLAALSLFLCAAASAQVAITQQPGDVRSAAQFAKDCAAGVGLSNCVTPSTPRNCQSSMHWTTAGSGIAHCVSDDPPCSYPSHLEHDYLGNPSCVPPVVTTGYEYSTQACPGGYVGPGVQQRRDVTYYDGVPAAYGAWQTTEFNCQLQPPPAPPAPPKGDPFANSKIGDVKAYSFTNDGRESVATMTFNTDGTWNTVVTAASGSAALPGNQSGRWFDPASGYTADQFELVWTLSEYGPDEPANSFSKSGPAGQYTSMGNGYSFRFSNNSYFCFAPEPYAKVAVTVRNKITGASLNGTVRLGASANMTPMCYG